VEGETVKTYLEERLLKSIMSRFGVFYAAVRGRRTKIEENICTKTCSKGGQGNIGRSVASDKKSLETRIGDMVSL
jgi:hypothetical protein